MSETSRDRMISVLSCRSAEELSKLAKEWGVNEESLVKWRKDARSAFDSMPGSNTAERPAEPLRLHHVGMVVPDEARMRAIVDELGVKETRRGHLEKYRVTNVFYRGNGGGELQFMLQAKGMLANFNRGQGGLHHVAFSVPDIESAQERWSDNGQKFIHPEPQEGIEGFRFNFVHPNLHGLNVELIEDPKESWDEIL